MWIIVHIQTPSMGNVYFALPCFKLCLKAQHINSFIKYSATKTANVI